jgi:murein DD-endopeptidase MepM/ murein hydrolase activator NlpD
MARRRCDVRVHSRLAGPGLAGQGRSRRHTDDRRVPGRQRPHGALRSIAAALLAAVLAGLPRPSGAAFWSGDHIAGYGLGKEATELRAQRELITRRRAQRAALQDSVRTLGREIASLNQRAQRARDAIAAQTDAVRSREMAHDRIVPRLLARERMLEQRRARAARALADLASLNRHRELAPVLRSRLGAAGPALLALVRGLDNARAALTQQHERVEQDRLQPGSRLPMLQAEAAQAQQQGDVLAERRRHAVQEIARLDTVLQQLSRASASLARRLMVIEAAHDARAEPQARQPAHDRNDLRLAAAVHGRTSAAPALVHASPPARTHVVARVATRQALERKPRLEPELAVHAAALPAARPLSAGRVDPGAPAGLLTAVAALTSRAEPGRLALPAPIRPSPRAVVRHDPSGSTVGTVMAALPGQRVEAPSDGKVVFANAFKSYGLLLIIEHDSEYHTLLWGFSKLRVAVGDKVTDGEINGVMDVVDGVRPRLGVELRRRGRPVDPLPWLAASSSKVRG